MIRLLDSTVTTTRQHWRRAVGLPEEIVDDPRPWLIAVAARKDAYELADQVAERWAEMSVRVAGELTDYLTGVAARHRGLRPDLLAAVRGRGRT